MVYKMILHSEFIALVEAETPIVWPPDAKNWLIWKDPDAGKDGRQEKKGTTEDEMVGLHHWLNGCVFEQAPEVGDGQGSLACYSPWGCKRDRHEWVTEWENNSVLLCSVAKSCPTHYFMNSSIPGFPLLHCLLEFAQTCLLSQWCHPTISSSVAPFFSCLPSFPASGSFPMSQLFTSGDQSNGASASATVLSVNIQGWFPLGLTSLISLQSKGHSRVFNTTVWQHQFFDAQPSFSSSSHIHTWLLEKP